MSLRKGEGVAGRVRFEERLATDGTIDIGNGNDILLRETVRKNGDVLSAEEVQEPKVHVTLSHSQLVNTVAQQVGGRSPKLVTELLQQRDRGTAFHVGRSIAAPKFVEPRGDRGSTVGFAKQDHTCHRHSRGILSQKSDSVSGSSRLLVEQVVEHEPASKFWRPRATPMSLVLARRRTTTQGDAPRTN